MIELLTRGLGCRELRGMSVVGVSGVRYNAAKVRPYPGLTGFVPQDWGASWIIVAGRGVEVPLGLGDD